MSSALVEISVALFAPQIGSQPPSSALKSLPNLVLTEPNLFWKTHQ